VPVQGTAVIRGRVVASDTGAPIRRAEVQAALGGQRSRGALTDADGRYELRDLPAGSWMLRATKTGFVAQQFGQRAPFAPSDPVVLADGQRLTADFALERGGVITGRVFDDGGDPLANVRVTAMRAQLTATGRRMVGAGAGLTTTDDTGAYRLHGLAPGAYYVSAVPLGNALSEGVLTLDGPATYAATYFPGTNDPGAAQRVIVSAGQEQPNIDFALPLTPTVRVSGTVIGSSGAPIQGMLNLLSTSGMDLPGNERRGIGTAQDGTFALPNVAPGNYILEFTTRAASRDVQPEMAALPIAVGGGDLTGVILTTSRGATVSGTITPDGGGRIETSSIRVSAPPVRARPGGSVPRAQVTSTGSFDLEGLLGPHSFRFDQLPAGWVVKSITANGTDVTDVPLDFRGTEHVSVRVVLTDRITELTGTIQSDASPKGAAVLVFSDDPSKWTPTSRYLRSVRAGEKGEFTLRALPGNQRYLAVALDYLESGEHLDPEFLERVKPLASSVSLAEGERKRVELTLNRRP
jgi:hypothetical protein